MITQYKGPVNKINPCLWFNTNAEEAVEFYVSVFKNSKIGRILRYGEEGKEIHRQPVGSVLTIEFQLDGTEFIALNGGPQFQFSEAVSFCINCNTQEEVDYYWNKLTDGGEESMCGWLKDRFGLSWQVVPKVLIELMLDKDAGKASRAMNAMFKMRKIEIDKIVEAANK